MIMTVGIIYVGAIGGRISPGVEHDLGLLVGSGRLGLLNPGLVGLGHGVNDTGESANTYGGHVAEVGRVAEEEQTGRGDREPGRELDTLFYSK